jgi:hypothetical protein
MRCAIAASLMIACPALAQLDWEQTPVPPVGGNYATVFDMSASADDDIWLVGEYTTGSLPWKYWNYALHFDGTAWTRIDPPDLDAGGYHNELSAVHAVSPTEAYAVGTTKWLGAQELVVFRWDGGTWEVDARNIIDAAAWFNDVGAAGQDLWAVGLRWNTGHVPPETSTVPLALRREGGQWVPHPVPPLAALGRSINDLNAVDGISETDAWAVGESDQIYTPGPSFDYTMVAVHWDGSQWTLDQTMPRTELTFLNDVTMIASDDVWAVGYHAQPGTNQPLIMHYDGTAWTRTEIDPFPGDGAILREVVALSATEVYALGLTHDGENVPLVLRYDGAEWTRINTPTTDGSGEQFMAATLTPSGTIWGAGIYSFDGRPFTLRTTPTTCRADLDGDGTLTIFDFLAFQNLFDAGSPEADFDGDGALTIFDFLAFQNEFDAGCD